VDWSVAARAMGSLIPADFAGPVVCRGLFVTAHIKYCLSRATTRGINRQRLSDRYLTRRLILVGKTPGRGRFLLKFDPGIATMTQQRLCTNGFKLTSGIFAHVADKTNNEVSGETGPDFMRESIRFEFSRVLFPDEDHET
jgi:hypothetical protein